MTHPNKVKGDRAEREAAAIIAGLLGFPARRKLGAGRADDTGDIDGIPATVVQVCDWKDKVRAMRVKPRECEQQQVNDAATFGATWVRLHGGEWRVVLTPEQWATYVREALG